MKVGHWRKRTDNKEKRMVLREKLLLSITRVVISNENLANNYE